MATVPLVPGISLNSIPSTTFDDSFPQDFTYYGEGGPIPFDMTKPRAGPSWLGGGLVGMGLAGAAQLPGQIARKGWWPALFPGFASWGSAGATGTGDNSAPMPIPPLTSTGAPSQPIYNPLAGQPTGIPYSGAPPQPPYNPLAGQPTGIPYYNPLAGKPAGNPAVDVPKPAIKPKGKNGDKAKPVAAPGMYALGGQTRAVGSGRNPLAYDPYYQGFRT